jgi:hypothetical protein
MNLISTHSMENISLPFTTRLSNHLYVLRERAREDKREGEDEREDERERAREKTKQVRKRKKGKLPT